MAFDSVRGHPAARRFAWPWDMGGAHGCDGTWEMPRGLCELCTFIVRGLTRTYCTCTLYPDAVPESRSTHESRHRTRATTVAYCRSDQRSDCDLAVLYVGRARGRFSNSKDEALFIGWRWVYTLLTDLYRTMTATVYIAPSTESYKF